MEYPLFLNALASTASHWGSPAVVISMTSFSCPSPSSSDFRFGSTSIILVFFSFIFFFPFFLFVLWVFLCLGWHFPAHLIFFHRAEAVALYGVSNDVADIQTFGALRQRGWLLLANCWLASRFFWWRWHDSFFFSLSSLSGFHWRRRASGSGLKGISRHLFMWHSR